MISLSLEVCFIKLLSVLCVSIMDSDFVQKLQNIKLMEDEGVVIRVGTMHRDRMLEECSLRLLGRFLTNRSFNQRATKTLLRSVWKMGSDGHIVDVGDGVFQFKFSMESQLKWVLANGPWSFEDHPFKHIRPQQWRNSWKPEK